jgi:hypothetical protein
MNNIKRIKIGNNSIKLFRKYFSLIAIGTIILGYVGFYSYAARYSLFYISPNITFIAGLGIFCILLLSLFYQVAKFRSVYRGIRILLLIYFLYLFSGNPLIIFGVFYGLNFGYNFQEAFFKRPSFSKLRKLYFKFNKRDKRTTLIVSSLFLLIGFFLNFKLFIIYMFLDSCLLEFQIAIFYKHRILNLLLLIILLPIFIFGYYIENSNYTLFGMTQQPISIIKKDTTILEGTLIYKDQNNLYLKDSSFVSNSNVYMVSYNSFAISLNDVQSYRTIQKKPNESQSPGLYELFRKIK